MYDTLTTHEVSQIITLARRAPLTNMAEAETAAVLLQKLARAFAPPPAQESQQVKEPTSAPPPQGCDGTS